MANPIHRRALEVTPKSLLQFLARRERMINPPISPLMVAVDRELRRRRRTAGGSSSTEPTG